MFRRMRNRYRAVRDLPLSGKWQSDLIQLEHRTPGVGVENGITPCRLSACSMLSSVEATLAGRLIPLLFNIAPLEDYPAARASAGLALRLSCVTYCHIRIKLAATSTDEPAFLAT